MKAKVRILHVIPDERLGGPQWRIFEVIKRLKDEGFFCIVVMPTGDKSFASILKEYGVPFYQIRSFKRLPPNLNPLKILKWFIYFIPGMITLIRVIKKNNIDIVHTNGFMSLQAPLAAKLSQVRLIWHLNDTITPKLIKTIFSPLLNLLPNKIAVSSKAVKRYYLNDSNDNTFLLPPPVDIKRFSPNYSTQTLRAEFGIKNSDKIIGSVGNINPAKGYEYFIYAAKIIKSKYPKVKFLTVGKKLETQKEYWKKLQILITNLGIKEDVIFTGFRTDIPRIMNFIDIFVLSSVSEAAPIVILEAMACAKPVVATRVGGIPEIVIDKETGILVPPKNPEAIAKAVLYLLQHPKKAKRMGLKGRKRVTKYFNSEKCAKKHRELYNNVMKSNIKMMK